MQSQVYSTLSEQQPSHAGFRGHTSQTNEIPGETKQYSQNYQFEANPSYAGSRQEPEFAESAQPSYDQIIGRVAHNNFGSEFREQNVKEEPSYYSSGRELKQEDRFSQRESMEVTQMVSQSPLTKIPVDLGNGSPMKRPEPKGNSTELKDLAMINPLLYKPASKPPVIREGDWLCPDPTVRVLFLFIVLFFLPFWLHSWFLISV